MSVLVIDDSKTVRLYHKEILEGCGIETDEAENGMEGIEKCTDREYSLFLVDVNMPVMDGYSFVSSIRKQERFATTPVVMISTEAEDTDRTKAYESGANLYYIKPVKPDELKNAVAILTGGGGV